MLRIWSRACSAEGGVSSFSSIVQDEQRNHFWNLNPFLFWERVKNLLMINEVIGQIKHIKDHVAIKSASLLISRLLLDINRFFNNNNLTNQKNGQERQIVRPHNGNIDWERTMLFPPGGLLGGCVTHWRDYTWLVNHVSPRQSVKYPPDKTPGGFNIFYWEMKENFSKRRSQSINRVTDSTTWRK